MGEKTNSVDIAALARALGIRRVRTIDPYNIKEAQSAIEEELNAPETSVIISESPCILLPKSRRDDWYPLTVDSGLCTGCKSCLMLGMSRYWLGTEGNKRKGKERKVVY